MHGAVITGCNDNLPASSAKSQQARTAALSGLARLGTVSEVPESGQRML